MKRKIRKGLCVLLAAGLLSGCGTGGTATPDSTVNETEETAETAEEIVTSLPKIDMTKWQYNAEDKVYYQLDLQYCESPADENYDTLAVIVPEAYMKGEQNADGTYTCEIDTEGSVGGYTAKTAPIVVPVNTPGYAAQAEMSEYSSQKDYTDAGFVYVHIGCRGREAGAPSGVVDMKAGIRYIRYNSGVIPGSSDRVFTFGMSGGGAQSAVLGASGDSELYTPYLQEIGAVMGVSDAADGSMCWCPITTLDIADAAYEWNMGVTRTGLDEETQKLSDGLAEAFGEYINALGLKDENGEILTLEKSDEGIYQSGSYYEYVKSEVERSLNNFLSDTEFPYDASASTQGGGFGMGGGRPDGMKGKPEGGEFKGGKKDFGDENVDFTAIDDIDRSGGASAGITLSGTYETAADYINALNANGEWVKYDEKSNTAVITSVSDFAKALKAASKSVGAFDDLNKTQGENTLFGYGDGEGAHFDKIEAELLKDTQYGEEFEADLEKTDAQGLTAEERVNMYDPLYYLLESKDGYNTSTPAKYWRIRTGIVQGDTSLSTEINLALALKSNSSVKSTDFETVWGLGHTMAERTGSSTENFINWVNECLSGE